MPSPTPPRSRRPRPALWPAVALTLLSLTTPSQAQPVDVSVCTALSTYKNPDPHPPVRCAVTAVPGPAHLPECTTLDHFGSSFAVGGDFNGDGEPDVVIGGSSDPEALGQSTQAWLFLGTATTATISFDGDGQTDLFGAALCFLPDLNGDGRDELAVGAPTASGTGRVFVFFGSGPDGGDDDRHDDDAPTRHRALPSADVILQGSVNNGRFGAALAAGDVDGDGFADLIVGAPGCPASDAAGFPGAVAWYSGRDLAGGGTAARPVDSGEEELPHKPRLLLASRAQRRWTGLLGADRFGYSVALAGDLNSDPGAEILIGAPQVDPTQLHRLRSATGSGYSFVVAASASPPLLQFGPLDQGNLPLSFGEGFGTAVAGNRDLDQDGVPDLVIGAPLFTAVIEMNGRAVAGIDNGRVWFLSGASGQPFFATDAEPTDGAQTAPAPLLFSDDPTAQLGCSLAFVDDVTGDGFTDLLVGARGETSTPRPCPWNRNLAVGDAVAGAVHVIDGRSGQSVTRITGVATLDLLGQAIAGWDMDGDGLAEIFCSAASWAPQGSPPSRAEQGQAHMMRGLDVAKR